MKSTLTSLLSLSFSVLLAGACTSLVSTGESPKDDLTSLSNGPNLPDECNVCWDDFQDCFADGSDVEQCTQQIVECVDSCQAPPPPPECLHCAAGFDACATSAQANGEGAQDCAVGFEGCLSACESGSMCDQDPALCEPPPQPDQCNACDTLFDECVNDQWGDGQMDPNEANQQCEQAWQDCWQACEPSGDPCQEAQDQCENNPNGTCDMNGQEISCEDLAGFCGDEPNQPPSECDLCQDSCEQGDPSGECPDFCAQFCP